MKTLKTVSSSVFDERMAVCRACDKNDASAFDGGGGCIACGCPLESKLRVAQVGCPLGKWGPSVAGAVNDSDLPGPRVVSQRVFDARISLCLGCSSYDPDAFSGGGGCAACGCPVQSKLRIPNSRCPLGKWGADGSFGESETASTISDMALSFFSSAKDFISSGFQRTPLVKLQERLDICKGCEFWDAEAFAGTGRCKQCGCSTQAKLRMASSFCPAGKWGALDKSAITQ